MIFINKKLPDQESFLRDLCLVPGCSPEELLFFDIETTGLSRERSSIYLIGCVSVEQDSRILRQWMAETKDEEKEILKKFLEFSKKFSKVIHYNGKRFDIPFVEARLLKYGLESAFDRMESLDLYQRIAPCKSLLKLEHLRQPDLEQFLSSGPVRIHCDGGACIPLYRKYLAHPSSRYAEPLLGHNEEDLDHLSLLLPALAYPAFLDGGFHAEKSWIEEETFYCECVLEQNIPKVISFSHRDGYFTADRFSARFQLRLNQGRLRQNYEDYRNYHYLPGEDTAIHKSLSSCLDASLRIPAAKGTCYTWFPCTEEFLLDLPGITSYLRHNLPLWIALL